MAEYKSQHTIPQVLLKNFSFDGKRCWTLNTKGEMHIQHINKIGAKDYHYEFRDKNNNIIHKTLMETKYFGPVEREMGSVFQECITLWDSMDDNPTGFSDRFQYLRESLIVFIAQTMNRSQFTINIMKTIPQFSKETANNDALVFSMMNTCVWADILNKHYCMIIHRNKTDLPFVTSTMGFSIEILPNTSYPFIYFPISSQYLIILTPRLAPMSDILINDDDKRVHQFIGIMSKAIDDILFIAQSEAPLKLLQTEIKRKTIAWKPTPTMENLLRNHSEPNMFSKYLEQSYHNLHFDKMFKK